MRPFAGAGHVWSLVRSRRRPLPFPSRLNFAVTWRCNQRCALCRIWERRGEELSLGEIREFFSRSRGFSWMNLTGGEILLREDIPQVLAAAVEANPGLALLQFPTNGSLPARAEEVVRGALRLPRRPPRLVVTVSLDGPRELHDSLRGVAGSFDRAVETFRRLRALPGCRVLFGMTLSPANAGARAATVEALARELPGVGAGDLHLNLFHRSAHYYGNLEAGEPGRDGEEVRPEDVAEARRALPLPLSLSAWAERGYLEGAGRYLREGRARPPLPCVALRATCFVAPDGTVYPCVAWDRPLGGLPDHGFDLRRLWGSPAAAGAREEIAGGGCPGCWTPCEAVPAMMAGPLRGFAGLSLSRGAPAPRPEGQG